MNEVTTQIRFRTPLLILLAIGLTCAALGAGIVIGGQFDIPNAVLITGMVISILLPFVLAGISFYSTSRHYAAREAMDPAEVREFLLAHRDRSKDLASAKRDVLDVLRRRNNRFAAGMVLLSLLITFLSGICVMRFVTAKLSFLGVISAFLLLAALTRWRFRPSRKWYREWDYTEEEDYPAIYAVVRRAADALGCTEPFYIDLLPDANAGIARMRDDYSVQLGAVLLGLLSEKELYQVMLHEFAHVKGREDQREWDYYSWLQSDACDTGILPVDVFASFLFLRPETQYEEEFELYRFAVSLEEETRADHAAKELGSAEAAASLLLKLKYTELYEYETNLEDALWKDTLEEWVRSSVSGKIEAIRAAAQERKAFYDSLIAAEIMPEELSHPIVRLRLETLGYGNPEQWKELPDWTGAGRTGSGQDPYRAEVEKAIRNTENAMLDEESAEEYLQSRREMLEVLSAWEEKGCPVQEAEYPDVLETLQALGRSREMEAFADRVLAELPEKASRSYARYMKGCHLLHDWDETGLDMIWQSIEDNGNFMEEGLSEIGLFCALTGNEKGMARFLEQGLEEERKKKEIYDKLDDLSSSDHLTGETLPEELANRILSYIREMDEGQFDTIYLLHKDIKEDFSVSPMIVRFSASADENQIWDSMHRIFRVLDSGVDDWQFSLFEYGEVASVKPEKIPGSIFYMPATEKETL